MPGDGQQNDQKKRSLEEAYAEAVADGVGGLHF